MLDQLDNLNYVFQKIVLLNPWLIFSKSLISFLDKVATGT